jgi:hypothetical protein
MMVIGDGDQAIMASLLISHVFLAQIDMMMGGLP